MKIGVATAAFLAPLLLIAACWHSEPAQRAPITSPKAAAIFPGNTGPATDSFSYLSGTSGTVVVPVNYFVTSIWAHNTTSGGTFTINPANQYTNPACNNPAIDGGPYDSGCGADAACDAAAPPGYYPTCNAAGTTITVPAATAYFLPIPVLRGAATELADGTTIVFASTDAYVVTLNKYGP